MQTLYGHKITDRVTVLLDPASNTYVGRFDGEEFARGPDGPSVVRAFSPWMSWRKVESANAVILKAEEAARSQRIEDDKFLDSFANLVNNSTISRADLDELIEVITRRNKGENT